MIAAYLFLRGHNAARRRLRCGPRGRDRDHHAVHGGGTRWVEARIESNPLRWIALGLLAAAARARARLLVRLPVHDDARRAHRRCRCSASCPRAERAVLRPGIFAVVVGSTLLIADRARAPVAARPPRWPPRTPTRRRRALMEVLIALGDRRAHRLAACGWCCGRELSRC